MARQSGSENGALFLKTLSSQRAIFRACFFKRRRPAPLFFFIFCAKIPLR
jgi:hypothetical protein